MTRVRGSGLRTERKTVIDEAEFQEMLKQTWQIKDTFLRLRATALLCLLRLTGKRRSEMATLELDSFKVENGFLNVTFTLLKKRKETLLTRQATKSIPLTDPLTRPILEYIDYLNNLNARPKFFFPRLKSLFGQSYILLASEHIQGRQIFNLVRNLTEAAWPHLFRETVASDVVKQDPTIIAAFKVQRRLDLESVNTGFNYLRRFSSDIIRREEQQIDD